MKDKNRNLFSPNADIFLKLFLTYYSRTVLFNYFYKKFIDMLLRLLVLITLLCTSFFNTLSQDNKIFKALFKEAESILLYLNEDEDALERFLQLEKMEPENAHIQFKIGICYLHIPGQKHKSVKHLEFA